MSTGLNCEFFSFPVVGQVIAHYYILERGEAPKQCWDWHEYADVYGPFISEDSAYDHLADNHANPGGSDNTGLVDPNDERWAALIARAIEPDRDDSHRMRRRS